MKPYVVTATLLVAWLGGTALSQDPQPEEQAIDAHLPLISQEDSPIQFDVKFWPTHILAGERVNMELTLRNVGTEPFRIPTEARDIYELRVNLYLDHREFGPRHREGNVFFSDFDLLQGARERLWKQVRGWDTVMPGEIYTTRSEHIFMEAGRQGAAETAIKQLESARIRTVIRLDDGNFVPSDWVEFTIEQPDPQEEDWRDDITVETRHPGTGEMRSFRSGLIQQRVGGKAYWFVAFRGEATLNLTRLPIHDIHQVIPSQHPDEGARGTIAVLGTSEAGEWFVYHPSRAHPGETIRSLGSDKHWRLQPGEDGQVKVIEADPR